MSFSGIIILYIIGMIFFKLVLPIFKGIVKLAQEIEERNKKNKARVWSPRNMKEKPRANSDDRDIFVNYPGREDFHLEPAPSSKLQGKVFVADPYSMEDLDHDESQHEARIKPALQEEVAVKVPKRLPLKIREGFIMAEILSKPKALQERGD